MKSIKRFWGNLSRRVKIAITLLALFLVGFSLYIFIGCPAFTAEQKFRRAEKAHMVGPGRILLTHDFSNNWSYEHMIVADDGDGVIFYEFSKRFGTLENLYYREKTGNLTVLAAPDMQSSISFDDGSYILPVFLFDNYPKAVKAELEVTLSETVNNVYFEQTYFLESQREDSGYFKFFLHSESDRGAEGFALRALSGMSGYDDSFNLRPQIVTVRLWNSRDELILEEDILLHCVAGQAHAEQGEIIPPKEHKKAAD